MNSIQTRLYKISERHKDTTATMIVAVAPVVTKMNELRSSNTVNEPKHRTMSIAFIASQIKGLSQDVRKVAQNIIEMQKFHTLPQLVSREEIDRKVLDSNETLLFLGLRDLPNKKYHKEIAASDRAKELKTGNNYLVNGILGPALYAVQAIRDLNAKDNDEESIMRAYNQALEYSKSENKKGVVLRMTLKSDARTITYSDFLRLLVVNNAQIKGDLENHPGFVDCLNVFLNTPTLVAIAQGYDAITMIPDGTIVILNRGALRIQKTNANARNSMYAQIMMEVDKQAEIDKEKKDKEEKKRKEQLRKQQEQEKKLLLDQKKAKLEQTHPALPQKTTKSHDVIAFDSDIFSVLSSRHDISNTEKMEIINFIQQYNDTDGETKRMLSIQLKEIMQ
jgi:hypothetical protein